MRWFLVVLGGLAVLAAPALVQALEAANGSTVTELFDAADVLADIGGQGSPTWNSCDIEFLLGGKIPNPGGDGEIAVRTTTSGEEIFFLVSGRKTGPNNESHAYSGLAMDDGSGARHLLQSEVYGDNSASNWMWIRSVRLPPSGVSLGPLSGGDPVVLVFRAQSDSSGLTSLYADLVTVDPSNPPDLTTDSSGDPLGYAPFYTLEDHDGGTAGNFDLLGVDFAMDSDGTIYVGPMLDGSIAKLSLNAAGAYVQASSDVSSGFDAGGRLLIGPGGDLYTWEMGFEWQGPADGGEHRTIYRIDPATGSASPHAFVASKASVLGWAFDSGGKLWIGLGESLKQKGKLSEVRYVVEVVAGNTTSRDDAVSDSANWATSLCGGPDGELYVLDSLPSAGSVWALTPGSGGGDDGGKPPKKPKK